VNSSTDLPDSSLPDLQLAQVDPPHPFKSALKTVAIATIVLVIAVAIFVFFVRQPPESAGQILQVNYYPMHSTENEGGDSGMPGASQPYDQLIILTKVQVRNQTNIPLFLQDISANVTMPDGSKMSSIGAGSSDFDRIFHAFPSLAPLRSAPFDRNATLKPGESIEGLAIFSFPYSQQQWNSRKSGDIEVSFLHQKNLVLTFPQ
jgi:hypothetical protein